MRKLLFSQVVIAADCDPKDLFKVDDVKEVDDADRALMDDLKITKDSVCLS